MRALVQETTEVLGIPPWTRDGSVAGTWLHDEIFRREIK